MARKAWVQSQVESYQRLKKWYLMPPCLTLSIIRYESRVKWSNPGKGVAPSPTPLCSSYGKGSLRVTLDYGRQLTYTRVVGLKSSSADIISMVDDFTCQWAVNTATLMEKVYGLQGGLLKNKTHLITFNESIWVSLWTFQPILIL